MAILTRTLIYDGLWGRIQDLPLDTWMVHRRFEYTRIDMKISNLGRGDTITIVS